MVRTHVYRVMDGNDAHSTLGRIDEQRKTDNKRILLDLPTKECEILLEKEVIIIIIIIIAKPVTCFRDFQSWYSALTRFFCMTVCQIVTARITIDIPNFL